MTSEKKPMQTKNKVLIAAITVLILAGAAVGIYFGVRKDDHTNNNLGQGSNNSTSGGTPTNSGGLPTPTDVPALNGTMINGTLFPYYHLTGDAPPPVGVAGTVYTNCRDNNTFSISFDDGPSQWTPELLDFLDKENIKVTFFVNGDNDGCIYEPKIQETLKRAYKSGHQIASHTWSHPMLTTLTADAIALQMTRVEDALRDILGVVPRYMRPPFGDGTFGNKNANDLKVQNTLKSLGYVITTWNIATKDADIDDNLPSHKLSDAALLAVEQKEVTMEVDHDGPGSPHMVLMHDTYMRTVRLLAPWVVDYAKKLNNGGYKLVPVATCLGDDDPRNWYKHIGPPAATTPTTCTK
ncbi:MAG: hypothetical protein J3Q66DRAFT_358456 [Benniella sp.]|nr:MAG: hypothetical protein J3Q66DRAFT_358456 [Benniella sp.]